MGEFAWLTWEATATLVAGIAAVVAAWRVGKRQTTIASRQADIQSEQTAVQKTLADIERTRLRMEMFERRHAVYQAAWDYVGWLLLNGTAPRRYRNALDESSTVSDAELQIARDFDAAMQTAPFLFRPAVAEYLNEVRDVGRKASHAARRARKFDDEPDSPEYSEAQRYLAEAENEIIRLESRFIRTFRPEMDLGEVTPQAEPDQ